MDPMRIEVHVYHHQDPEISTVLQQMSQKLDSIQTKETHIMAALDALTAQVAANTTVEGSALTLIQGLAAQLAAAGSNPTALAALQTQLKTSADALAAAVAANTPATAPTA
jgi:hypothetical protein